MPWRPGTEASSRFPGPRAVAGPVCGVLLLLAGARAPAQTSDWPPAWVPPRSATYYHPTAWRRQATAELSPPASLRLLAPDDAALPGSCVVHFDGAAPEPLPGPMAVIRCSGLGGPDADDDVPVFPIQLRPRRGAMGPEMGIGRASEEPAEAGMPQFIIQLQPPGPERLFRLESEANFQERIRQATPRRPFEPVIFPDEPVLSESKEPPERAWPPRWAYAEANYVCYDPLFFEQKYLERYGWDLGPISPAVSLMKFWYDSLLFPYHLVTSPGLRMECNAGYCLPGDPTPLRLDPPKWPFTVQVNYYTAGQGHDGCGCATH